MVSDNWGKQKSRNKKVKTKFDKMNINELRAYAKKNKLNAKDTSKSELIKEIKEEEKQNGN